MSSTPVPLKMCPKRTPGELSNDLRKGLHKSARMQLQSARVGIPFPRMTTCSKKELLSGQVKQSQAALRRFGAFAVVSCSISPLAQAMACTFASLGDNSFTQASTLDVMERSFCA